MSRIYKILSRAEWAAAEAAGAFEGSAVDRQDGYIHFSTAEQAQETAEKHFRGQPDLVVLEIEADDLADALRWEPSRGGALFPHLHGALDVRQVRRVFEAPLDSHGVPQLVSLPPLHGEGQPGAAGQGGEVSTKPGPGRLAPTPPPLAASRPSPPREGEGGR